MSQQSIQSQQQESQQSEKQNIDSQPNIQAQVQLTKQELQDIFNKFDRDNSGFIDDYEIPQLANELGVNITLQEIRQIFKDIDSDGNGKINFEEFYLWWYNGRPNKLETLVIYKLKSQKLLNKGLQFQQQHQLHQQEREDEIIQNNIEINFQQFRPNFQTVFEYGNLQDRIEELSDKINYDFTNSESIFIYINFHAKQGQQEALYQSISENDKIKDYKIIIETILGEEFSNSIDLKVKKSDSDSNQVSIIVQIKQQQFYGEIQQLKQFLVQFQEFKIRAQFSLKNSYNESQNDQKFVENLLSGFNSKIRIQGKKSFINKIKQLEQQQQNQYFQFLKKLLNFRKLNLNFKNIGEDLQQILDILGLSEFLEDQPSNQDMIDSFFQFKIYENPVYKEMVQEFELEKYTNKLDFGIILDPYIVRFAYQQENDQDNIVEEQFFELEEKQQQNPYLKSLKQLIFIVQEDEYFEFMEKQLTDNVLNKQHITQQFNSNSEEILKEIKQFYTQLNYQKKDLLTNKILLPFFKEFRNLPVLQSNAITIYNFLNLPLSNLNLEGVDIPYANLKNSICHNTNFRNSNLKNVDFRGSILNDADFSGSQLDNAIFKQEINMENNIKSHIICADICCSNIYLALGCSDNSIIMYNLIENQIDFFIYDHSDKIQKVKFSHNGKLLASSSRDETIKIFEICHDDKSYNLIHNIETKCQNCDITFKNGNQNLFYSDFNYVRNYDLQKRDKTIQTMGLDGKIQGVSVDHIDKCIFIRNDNKIIIQAVEGAILRYCQGHTQQITTTVPSPLGNFIVSGDIGGQIHFWDRNTGEYIKNKNEEHKKLQELAHDGQQINSVYFSSDGLFAFSAGEDGSARGWAADDSGEINQTFVLNNVHNGGVKQVFTSYDIENIFTVDEKGIFLWKWYSNSEVYIEKYISIFSEQKISVHNTNFSQAQNLNIHQLNYIEEIQTQYKQQEIQFQEVEEEQVIHYQESAWKSGARNARQKLGERKNMNKDQNKQQQQESAWKQGAKNAKKQIKKQKQPSAWKQGAKNAKQQINSKNIEKQQQKQQNSAWSQGAKNAKQQIQQNKQKQKQQNSSAWSQGAKNAKKQIQSKRQEQQQNSEQKKQNNSAWSQGAKNAKQQIQQNKQQQKKQQNSAWSQGAKNAKKQIQTSKQKQQNSAWKQGAKNAKKQIQSSKQQEQEQKQQQSKESAWKQGAKNAKQQIQSDRQMKQNNNSQEEQNQQQNNQSAWKQGAKNAKQQINQNKQQASKNDNDTQQSQQQQQSAWKQGAKNAKKQIKQNQQQKSAWKQGAKNAKTQINKNKQKNIDQQQEQSAWKQGAKNAKQQIILQRNQEQQNNNNEEQQKQLQQQQDQNQKESAWKQGAINAKDKIQQQRQNINNETENIQENNNQNEKKNSAWKQGAINAKQQINQQRQQQNDNNEDNNQQKDNTQQSNKEKQQNSAWVQGSKNAKQYIQQNRNQNNNDDANNNQDIGVINDEYQNPQEEDQEGQNDQQQQQQQLQNQDQDQDQEENIKNKEDDDDDKNADENQQQQEQQQQQLLQNQNDITYNNSFLDQTTHRSNNNNNDPNTQQSQQQVLTTEPQQEEDEQQQQQQNNNPLQSDQEPKEMSFNQKYQQQEQEQELQDNNNNHQE